MAEKALAMARKGAHVILRHSLSLLPTDELLIITDENHVPELQLLSQVAHGMRIKVTPVLIPRQMQYAITDHGTLPAITRDAIKRCDGLIVLTEYSAASTPFRMALLSYFFNLSKRGKAASMPGVTLHEFSFAAADFEEIDRAAETLGNLLLRANTVVVETVDHLGETHRLTIGIRGSFPSMCGSRINEGDWDNVPTGETFVLPASRQVHGSIVITGSVPDLVLFPSAEVVLTVERGRMSAIEASSPEVAEHARSLFFRNYATRLPAGKNATMLSELGFGVNRRIQQLYGVPLFDEKVLGSVHVAFGRNNQLGGRLRGPIHHDLVTLSPTVYIDTLQSPIVANREILVTPEQAALDWTDVKPKLNRNLLVTRTGMSCSFDQAGDLTMEWFQCSGPKASTRIGNHDTANLAGKAYKLLVKPMTVSEVVDALAIQRVSRQAALAAIEVLRSYRLIKLRRRGPAKPP